MNILIVDDSRLARKELIGLLQQHPGHRVLGEAANVKEAVILVDALRPDLLLLDIHLPDGSGFDLLEQAGFTPRVIFTTAYEQHALRAFEVNALDYLLKPVTAERLARALDKHGHSTEVSGNVQDGSPGHKNARSGISQGTIAQVTDTHGAGANGLSGMPAGGEHLFIRDGERCHFVRFDEIRLLEVDGNYVRLFFRDTCAMLARSLHYVEARLAPQRFFRANRQQIVNLDYIAHIEPWIGDGLMIWMQDGRQVEVSRRQTRELKQRLEM